jgi:hypothetical protein
MSLRRFRNGTLIVVALGAGLTTALLLYLSVYGFIDEGFQWSGLLQLFGFLVWANVPYLAVYWLAAVLVHGRGSAMLVLISSFAVVIFGAVIYFDAFIVHLDAQSALVFLFVPLYQLLAVAALLGALAIIRAVSKSKFATNR